MKIRPWLLSCIACVLAACGSSAPTPFAASRYAPKTNSPDLPSQPEAGRKPASQSETESKREKPYKKPVRMNGRGEVSSMPMEEFFALHQQGKALVFDARPAFLYALGHVPSAINLPKHNCDEQIHTRHEATIKAAIAAGKAIVVYCSGPTCPDARAVAQHISGFGYPASVFTGGWDAWKEAGLPKQ